MSVLLRYVLLAVAVLLIVRFAVRVLARIAAHRRAARGPSPHDRSKEVGAGSYDVEDVQDAKFRDL